MNVFRNEFLRKHENVIIAMWFLFLSLTFNASIYVLNPSLDVSGSQWSTPQLDLQFAYTAERGAAVVSSWHNGGANYLRLIWIDLLFALAYGPFFFLWIRKLGGSHTIANIALGEMFTNWTETSMEIYWVANHTPETPLGTLFLVHSLIATIKWSLVPVYIGYALWLTVKNVTSWISAVARESPTLQGVFLGRRALAITCFGAGMVAIKLTFAYIHGH